MATLSQAAGTSASPTSLGDPLWRPLGLVLLAAAAVATGWAGFIASDDVSYYLGAREWLERPPFPGSDHWTTRFPVVLPLAAAMAVLGQSPAALAATSLLWYIVFVAAGGALAWRAGGPRAGWIGAVLLATMPLSATSGSIVNCDLPEASFLILGILLLTGSERGSHAFGAGICFGAAVLCRETAVLALMGLFPLFLLGRTIGRRAMLVAAGGGALVLGSEMLFQALLTGDPFHRYALAFNHDSTLDRSLNLEGNLLVHPLLDPLLVLFLNNEFGLLFWLAVAGFVAGAHRSLTPEGKRSLLVTAALSAAAFLLVAALSAKLVLNPRYFTIPAVAAALLAAIWLARLASWRRYLLLGGTVASNLLLLSAQNSHPHWPSEALVIAARAHPQLPISADAATLHRAELPIEWNRLRNIVPETAPAALRLVKEVDGERPGRIVTSYPSPPTRLGYLVQALGLRDALPGFVRRRLITPSTGALLLSSEPPPR